MRSPTISVILSVYNGQETLSLALESALNQTIAPDDYEIVVVNDGSTDQTERIIRSYAAGDDRFKIVNNEKNIGLSEACNRGIVHASGDFVIRLDDDDMFEASILKKMSQPLQAGITDLVYSDRYELDHQLNEMEYISLKDSTVFQMIAAGVMMRRELLEALGGYRPVFWEEYDLYIRYAQLTEKPFYYLNEPLYRYTKRDYSLTGNPQAVKEGWKELRSLWAESILEEFGFREIE